VADVLVCDALEVVAVQNPVVIESTALKIAANLRRVNSPSVSSKT
jgi:hypothetical protein